MTYSMNCVPQIPDADDENSPTLYLGDYCWPAPIIKFADCPIGVSSSRQLFIVNTSGSPAVVKILQCPIMPAIHKLTFNPSLIELSINKKQSFTINWIPKHSGSWCEDLCVNYTVNSNINVDLLVKVQLNSQPPSTPKPSKTSMGFRTTSMQNIHRDYASRSSLGADTMKSRCNTFTRPSTPDMLNKLNRKTQINNCNILNVSLPNSNRCCDNLMKDLEDVFIRSSPTAKTSNLNLAHQTTPIKRMIGTSSPSSHSKSFSWNTMPDPSPVNRRQNRSSLSLESFKIGNSKMEEEYNKLRKIETSLNLTQSNNLNEDANKKPYLDFSNPELINLPSLRRSVSSAHLRRGEKYMVSPRVTARSSAMNAKNGNVRSVMSMKCMHTPVSSPYRNEGYGKSD